MNGFTLIEMLAVMGVIAVLTALVVPAVTALSKSNRLNSGAAMVSNLLTAARTEAINAGTAVQLRVVTTKWNIGGAEDTTAYYRKISLWEWKRENPSNSSDPNWTPVWMQISSMQNLPEDVIFEIATDPTTIYTFPQNNPAPNDPASIYFLGTAYSSPNNPQVLTGTSGDKVNPTPWCALMSGQTVGPATANFVSVEFLPDGSLNLGTPTLTATQFYLMLTEGVYSGSGALLYTQKTKAANWALVSITPLTGRISVVRP